MSKQEAKPGGFPFAMQLFPDFGKMPNLFAQSAEAFQQAFMDWQNEISAFVADRIQQDAESLQLLADERTVPGLLKVQQDWFAAVMRDYTQESRKLMDIASRLGNAGVGFEKKQTKKVGIGT